MSANESVDLVNFLILFSPFRENGYIFFSLFSDSRHSSMTKVKLSVIDMHKLCQVEYYDKCSPINNIAIL